MEPVGRIAARRQLTRNQLSIIPPKPAVWLGKQSAIEHNPARAPQPKTAAACASYFLIVADFSRSSVFTLAQMNGSASTGAASTTPTPSG